eukprot:gene15543-17769_t
MAPLVVAGYLRMSEKSKRMNSQGKELFRFVSLANNVSDAYPEFNANTSTILVASGAASDRKKAKQKSDNFMPDLYVLAEILEEERKGDEWKARVVEMLGECTDLHSCGLVLAHKGRLLDGNKALDSNKPPRTEEKKSGTKSVFDSRVSASTAVISPSPCVLTEDRVDLRTSKCTIFSVDPPGCVDIDDAVHVRVYSPEERVPLESSVVNKLGLDTASATERNAVLSNTVLYEVGIHIADVVNYVKNHCHTLETTTAAPSEDATLSMDTRMQKIALEALHRSFTVYLPNQQIPILPAYLSHDACSLRAGEDRYTISCILTLAAAADSSATVASSDTTASTSATTAASVQSRTFAHENTSVPLENPLEERAYKIIAYRFQKSLISSAGAFTYDQVDQFLDGNTTTSATTSATVTAATTGATDKANNNKNKSNKTNTKTSASATVSAAETAPKSLLNTPKGLPKDVKYSLKLFRKLFPSLDSHKIIEQLMLMANICAAEFLQAHSLLSDDIQDAHCDTLSAYLLRRQLPAGYDPLLPPDSAENSAILSARASASATRTTQRGAFTGVPVELTAHPAEYILCPASNASTGTTVPATAASRVESEVKQLSAIEMAHASLGCDVYTHFTSPIRRYADQLVHALMNRLLSRNTTSDASMAALSLCQAPAVVMRDPWLQTLTPANVAHINAKQKQHKKFQREMTIVEFVFSQCTAAGSNEATIDAEAVVLPMRYSDKHRGYKADLFVLAPCAFVYPLRLHTRAQASLYEATYTAHSVSLRNKQTGEVKRLKVGQKISVQVHCSRSAASMRKKCVVSSPEISF